MDRAEGGGRAALKSGASARRDVVSSQESWYSDSDGSPARGPSLVSSWRASVAAGAVAAVEDDGEWVSVTLNRWVERRRCWLVEGVDDFDRPYDMEVKPSKLFPPQGRVPVEPSPARPATTRDGDDDDFNGFRGSARSRPAPQPAPYRATRTLPPPAMPPPAAIDEARRAIIAANRAAAVEKLQRRQVEQRSAQPAHCSSSYFSTMPLPEALPVIMSAPTFALHSDYSDSDDSDDSDAATSQPAGHAVASPTFSSSVSSAHSSSCAVLELAPPALLVTGPLNVYISVAKVSTQWSGVLRGLVNEKINFTTLDGIADALLGFSSAGTPLPPPSLVIFLRP